ncbi:MAG: hypothetical protein QOH69_2956 [Actinomycetota bacterium]|jgi:hypothetical protein|nr:hypothetical protein [Actinomycetota bacterium]
MSAELEEADGPTGRELLFESVEGWRYALARIQQPLRRDAIADGWIAGLRDGGWRAGHGKRWNGKWMGDLPFVISLPCPFGHPDEDDSDFASVQLVVREDGWPYFNPELKGQCTYCTASMLENWLMDCARCERGERSERHTPGHPKGSGHWRRSADDGYQIIGDVSPLSFVVWQFDQLHELAKARHWVQHTAEASAEYRERSKASDPEQMIAFHIERARRMLAEPALKALPAGNVKVEWSQAASVNFLDELKDADGNLIVPESSSAAAAWETVKALSNRPSKHSIEDAQKERKARPTAG